MKKSTKIVLKGAASYVAGMALAFVGSYHLGRWAGKAKTIPGMVGRLSGCIALCAGSSYMMMRAMEKDTDDYYDATYDEAIEESISKTEDWLED